MGDIKGTAKEIEKLLGSKEQKLSQEFLEKVTQILKFKERVVSNKAEATDKLEHQKTELAVLERKIMFETDPAQIQEFQNQKREIRYAMDDCKDMLEIDEKKVLKEMLDGLEDMLIKSAEEYSKINVLINEQEKNYREALEEFKKQTFANIEDVKSKRNLHAHKKAEQIYHNLLEFTRR